MHKIAYLSLAHVLCRCCLCRCCYCRGRHRHRHHHRHRHCRLLLLPSVAVATTAAAHAEWIRVPSKYAVGKYATIEIINYMEYRFLAPVYHSRCSSRQRCTSSAAFLLIYWKQFIMYDCKMSSSGEMRFFSCPCLTFTQFFTQLISCIKVNNYLKVNAFTNCTKMIREKYDQVFCSDMETYQIYVCTNSH